MSALTDKEILDVARKYCEFSGEGTYHLRKFQGWAIIDVVRECIELLAELSASPAAPDAAKPSEDAPNTQSCEMSRHLAATLHEQVQSMTQQLSEERETVRQLNRALRDATEAPTFMGEPVRAAKPEQQAQAGEPEVFAWNESKLPDGTEVIALQAHREAMHVMAPRVKSLQTEIEVLDEAIAKKDAALKACVEFMRRHAEHDQKCGVLDLDENDRHCACDCGFDAAITQAEEAMK